jgi:hypothetical protein
MEEQQILERKIAEIELAVRSSNLILPGDEYHRIYWRHVVPLVKNDGLWMEFGVFRGRSIQQISSLTSNIVYGLDSFQGLHEHWDDENPKGVYSSGGITPRGAIIGKNHSMFDPSETLNVEPWNENIRLISGFFDKTLPDFLIQHTENAAFLHIDSDLYSSCSTIFKYMKDRIVPGTIICFDELLDYPTYKQGEIKAFAEFLLETNNKFEPLIYNGGDKTYSQACIRILA